MVKKIENINSLSELKNLVNESKVSIGEWGGRCYHQVNDNSGRTYSIPDIIFTLKAIPEREKTSLKECKAAIKKLDKDSTLFFETELNKKNPLIWVLGKIQQLFDKIFFNIDKSLNKISWHFAIVENFDDVRIEENLSDELEFTLNVSDPESMVKEAEKFSERKRKEIAGAVFGEGGQAWSAYHNRLNAIKNILNDRKFQNSPAQYIYDLKNQLNTEKCELIKKDVLEFFTIGLNLK